MTCGATRTRSGWGAGLWSSGALKLHREATSRRQNAPERGNDSKLDPRCAVLGEKTLHYDTSMASTTSSLTQ